MASAGSNNTIYTLSGATSTAASWTFSNNYGPIKAIKVLKIEGIELFVYKYSNYKIAIQDLAARFENTHDGTEVYFSAGDEVIFDNIAEAKAFIHKLKSQAKKMRAFARECSMNSDFV